MEQKVNEKEKEKMVKHMVTQEAQLSVPSEPGLVLEFLSLNNYKFKKLIVLTMVLQEAFKILYTMQKIYSL